MDGKELLEQLASGALQLSFSRMTPDPADAAHMDNLIRAMAEHIAIAVRAAPNGEGKRTAFAAPLALLPEMAAAALKVWLPGCDDAIEASLARVTKG